MEHKEDMCATYIKEVTDEEYKEYFGEEAYNEMKKCEARRIKMYRRDRAFHVLEYICINIIPLCLMMIAGILIIVSFI